MFIKKYNPSAGEANVIEVYNDVFKNELRINSVHVYTIGKPQGVYIKDVLPVPVNVVYKSNPIEEKLYFVYGYSDEKASNNMIWNIDRRKNIKLTRGNGQPKNYYELTKEQLFELCKAKTLMLQVNGKDRVMWEGYATVFMPYIQAVYHEAIDNTMFPDAKKKALLFIEDKIRKAKEKKDKEEREFQKKWKAQDKKDNRIIWITIVVSVIVSVAMIFLVISLSS